MNTTLYVNGDSHTAGTYKNYFSNLKECATALLAKKYDLKYLNQARAGGSNDRIIRVSKQSLENLDPASTIVFIGWTTFERTEWFEDGTWHQICGQPWYQVNDNLKERWRKYITWSEEKENYHQLAVDWQSKIYDFHLWLKERKFIHRFYHGHHCFDMLEEYKINWPQGVWVEDSPYNYKLSFTKYSESLGFKPDDYLHYDYDAHKEYAELLESSLQQMLKELKTK